MSWQPQVPFPRKDAYHVLCCGLCLARKGVVAGNGVLLHVVGPCTLGGLAGRVEGR